MLNFVPFFRISVKIISVFKKPSNSAAAISSDVSNREYLVKFHPDH